MNILAFETSCDETAVAIVRDGREILSSSVYSQIGEHAVFGGVVPEIASRLHTETVSRLTGMALTEAGLPMEDIDAVAVTYTPGLIGALLVGVNFAKGVAYANNKPIIGVNHIKGHVAANYLCHPELEPPFMALVISGSHSHIMIVRDYTTFEVVAKTCDDAVGEAYDKVARVLGLGYPGGVMVEKLARAGDSRKLLLPRPKVEGSKYDMSFSGLKTAVINYLHRAEQKGEPVVKEDVCAAFQLAVCDILHNRLELCAADFGFDKIVLAGGVSANGAVREMAAGLCEAKGYALYFPPVSLCGDNAAMIAAQGYYEYMAGNIADIKLNGKANEPVDYVC